MENRDSKPMAAPDLNSTRGTRRTKMRVMQRKSVGVMAVYEQDPTVDNAGSRMLVFEMPAGSKKVSEFPPEWHRLTDDELAAIRRAG